MVKAWADDFAAFLRDVGPAPLGHTLDRIDVNDDYKPGNCRWATPSQQANNMRTNIRVSVKGKGMTLKEAADSLGLNYKSLHGRMKYAGDSFEEAVTHVRRNAASNTLTVYAPVSLPQ